MKKRIKPKTQEKPLKLSLRLEQNRNIYTKAEKKLHAYISDHLREVMYASLTELSETCGVGEATILRFCRKIGFSGYQDFKLAVAQELTLVVKVSENETFIEKIKINMISVLNDTYEVIDKDKLQEAISLIEKSEDIVVYGVGHSGIAALDLKSRFLRIGKNVDVITDPHFQIMRSCSVNEDSVILAISLSGSTKDIVDAVCQARKSGAKIVAITNYVKSPLTKQSDLVLLTSGKENPMEGGSLVAKVSQLYVIDLICTGLGIRSYEKTKEMKNKTAKAISEKMY